METALRRWYVAIALNAVLIFLAILQTSAMWAFTSHSVLEHPSIGGGLYAHSILIVLYAAWEAWNLTNLYCDVKKAGGLLALNSDGTSTV